MHPFAGFLVACEILRLFRVIMGGKLEKDVSTNQQLPSLDEQRNFWDWHWQNWEQRKVMNDWTERRAHEILALIRSLSLKHPRMLDFGCGRGWFTERLADLGEAHGIDLSPEGIATAQLRRPDIRYLAGSVYDAPLAVGYFDVVISQEVIAHVEDQPRYVERAAEILKPGGYFIVTTGNKYVIDRLGDVGWVKQPEHHIRRELYKEQLKKMLLPSFEIVKYFTIIPHGTLGILRVVNSFKLNQMASLIVPQAKLSRLKEKAGFGWQMIFLVKKRV
jgi:2-polyprenyl-3-methyl-5-hydroxy-6-metoxy-1,4-benzoquinol methylase